MAVRKIYTSRNQELVIDASEHGIHLIITTQDVEFPTEFIFELNDVPEFIEHLESEYDLCELTNEIFKNQ